MVVSISAASAFDVLSCFILFVFHNCVVQLILLVVQRSVFIHVPLLMALFVNHSLQVNCIGKLHQSLLNAMSYTQM